MLLLHKYTLVGINNEATNAINAFFCCYGYAYKFISSSTLLSILRHFTHPSQWRPQSTALVVMAGNAIQQKQKLDVTSLIWLGNKNNVIFYLPPFSNLVLTTPHIWHICFHSDQGKCVGFPDEVIIFELENARQWSWVVILWLWRCQKSDASV